MDGEKISSFKGLSLSTYDREILKGPWYITDDIIEFYFRFLANTYEEEDILLVPPAVSYLLANCTDSDVLRHTAESLKLCDKKLVFFTINNADISTDLFQVSTPHWSLLVYYRTSNVFVYHDSVKGLNYFHARKLYNAVKDFAGDDCKPPLGLMTYLRPKKVLTKKRKHAQFLRPSRWDDDDDDEEEEEEATFVESFTPQQTNAYDCGLYVMRTAAVICEWYLSKKDNENNCLWSDEVKNHVIGSYVENHMRSEILELMDFAQGECL